MLSVCILYENTVNYLLLISENSEKSQLILSTEVLHVTNM